MESSSPSSSSSSSLQYINFPRQPALPPIQAESICLPLLQGASAVYEKDYHSCFFFPSLSFPLTYFITERCREKFSYTATANAVGRTIWTILKNFGFFPSPCEYICEILIFSHFHVNITFAPLLLLSISQERRGGVGRGSWDLKGQTANDPWLEIQLSISSPPTLPSLSLLTFSLCRGIKIFREKSQSTRDLNNLI